MFLILSLSSYPFSIVSMTLSAIPTAFESFSHELLNLLSSFDFPTRFLKFIAPFQRGYHHQVFKRGCLHMMSYIKTLNLLSMDKFIS